MLLNLMVREFPGFVGKQAAQVSSDQESGNGGIMLVLPIFVSKGRRASNLTCFETCRVQGHCYLLNSPLVHWTCSRELPTFPFCKKNRTQSPCPAWILWYGLLDL